MARYCGLTRKDFGLKINPKTRENFRNNSGKYHQLEKGEKRLEWRFKKGLKCV